MRFCYKCGGEIFPGQEYAYSKLGTRHKMPACKDAGASYEPAPFDITSLTRAITRSDLPRMLGKNIIRTREIRQCYMCDKRSLTGAKLKQNDYGVIFDGSWQVWKVANWQFWLPPKIEIRFLHYPECPRPKDFPTVSAGILLSMPGKATKRRLPKAA